MLNSPVHPEDNIEEMNSHAGSSFPGGRVFFISLAFFLVLICRVHGTVYEAEKAQVLYQAVVENKNAGYSGEAYINFDNVTGSYMELHIGMAVAGVQTVMVRYANGVSSARTMDVHVNGSLVQGSLAFPPTGDWTSWTTVSFQADLVQGVNTMRFTSVSSDGGPNIDYLDVSGTALEKYSLTIHVNGPGSVTVTPAGMEFFNGQLVSLQAVPQLNAIFKNWSGDLVSTVARVDHTITDNNTITASFEETVVDTGEPDFALYGYATLSGDGVVTTTGGTGGTEYVFSNYTDIADWLYWREKNKDTAPAVVYIEGTITPGVKNRLDIKRVSNISFIGKDPFGELDAVGLYVVEASNIIIRNLKIHHVTSDNSSDAICIDESHHVWVDHCELYSDRTHGIDYYDGLLDIKNGSRYITVSWNYIHDHYKTSLIGHTDDASQAPIDSEFRITYHHNYFRNTDGRNPSLRFGVLHIYNNYYENISDYAVAIRQGAHARIEYSHFESVKTPITTNKFSGPAGFACVEGNAYTGSCTEASNSITQVDCAFWTPMPYLYTPDPVNKVALLVKEYAGVGKLQQTLYLSTLSASTGILSPTFNTQVTQYELVVPAGTTELVISASTTIPGAVITGTGVFSQIPGIAIITVASADGTTNKEYKINVTHEILSNDATLSVLSFNVGMLSPAFNPATTSYGLLVPAGTTSIVITATPNHPGAAITGGGIFNLPGTANIVVTAEDGTIKTYTVVLSITGLGDPGTAALKLYPNPVTGFLRIDSANGAGVVVHNALGVKILESVIDSDHYRLNLESLSPGAYFVTIAGEKGAITRTILKK